METNSSVTQASGNQVVEIDWPEIHRRLEQHDVVGKKVFGVPRGGMIATGFLKNAENVDSPDVADVILDDILDSGRTRDRYRESHPDKPFVVLVNKQEEFTGSWVKFPWESETGPEDAVVRMLELIGEDPKRDGLLDTPKRVVKAMREMTAGYGQDPESILNVTFEADYDQMVLVRDIEFFSLCEHHMLPFFGVAHVGYIPGERVVGLSKVARLVEVFAKRLQIQERMTEQIAQALVNTLETENVGVVIEAQHLCMVARGVKKQNAKMVTSALYGSFRNTEARMELLSLCGLSGR